MKFDELRYLLVVLWQRSDDCARLVATQYNHRGARVVDAVDDILQILSQITEFDYLHIGIVVNLLSLRINASTPVYRDHGV